MRILQASLLLWIRKRKFSKAIKCQVSKLLVSTINEKFLCDEFAAVNKTTRYILIKLK
jgi:hypothetical protein